MPLKALIIPVLLLSSAMASYAQPSRSIYLGDNMETAFDSSRMIKSTENGNPFFEFLGYQTRWHSISNNADKEDVNRLGVVLPAQSTITTTITGTAGFGKNNDSCTIEYRVSIDKTRNGRSAALSVVNLFSKKENRIAQDEPETTVDNAQSRGIIFSNDQKAHFLYGITHKGMFRKPSGWLIVEGDTLYTKPVALQKNKKGKLKKPNYGLPAGLLLVKGDSIYGAIDLFPGSDAVYISRQLTESKKLIIATYFFMITCYQNLLTRP